MSRLLLDTQLLVWAALTPERMPADAAQQVEDPLVEVNFSLISVWEVAIKFALGRTDFNLSPQVLYESLLRFGYSELPILPQHVIAVAQLPHHHRDPFDRLLLAQAQVEGLTLMTTDKTLARYGPFVKRYR